LYLFTTFFTLKYLTGYLLLVSFVDVGVYYNPCERETDSFVYHCLFIPDMLSLLIWLLCNYCHTLSVTESLDALWLWQCAAVGAIIKILFWIIYPKLLIFCNIMIKYNAYSQYSTLQDSCNMPFVSFIRTGFQLCSVSHSLVYKFALHIQNFHQSKYNYV
jgi:hypothetical protein